MSNGIGTLTLILLKDGADLLAWRSIKALRELTTFNLKDNMTLIPTLSIKV